MTVLRQTLASDGVVIHSFDKPLEACTGGYQLAACTLLGWHDATSLVVSLPAAVGTATMTYELVDPTTETVASAATLTLSDQPGGTP